MTDIVEDWETMSWDFSNEESTSEYESEPEEYVESLTPINLSISLKKIKFTQNLAEIKNINDKKNNENLIKEKEVCDDYINIVKPHLNWVKKNIDVDDSDDEDVVRKVRQQPVDNNFPELSLKTLSMKKIANDNSWIQQKPKEQQKQQQETYQPKFVKHDKESMIKTRMCNNGNNCTMGTRCKFAHSMDELNILSCTYNNCNYKCNYIHKNETREEYFERQKKLKLPQEITYAISKIPTDKKIVVNGTIYSGTEKKVKVKKDIKYVEEDPNKVYIRNKNIKLEEIKTIKNYISRNEESIKRLSHNSPVSSALIIKKLKDNIKDYTSKLKTLEDEFSKIKIEKKKVEIVVVKEEPKIEEPKPKVEKPKEIVTVQLFTNKKIVKDPVEVVDPVKDHVVVEEVVDTNKNAWVEIKKNKKTQPVPAPAPVPVPVVVQKSQMCRSYTMKTKCPHGAKCRYAHNPNELNVNNCGYGADCKFVKLVSKEYVNTTSKCCVYKHPNETKVNFFKRNKF